MKTTGDFLSMLKTAVGVGEQYELSLEKVQHAVKKGEVLVRLRSRLLPPEVYLSIEKYVGETVGPGARVVIQYQ
ncbi:MAG: hypothetical protein GXW96_04970, partial [Christensenellaceae bacterium]|nr:hypothetical protein [Christensenellaceae bacterium]